MKTTVFGAGVSLLLTYQHSSTPALTCEPSLRKLPTRVYIHRIEPDS